MSFDSIKADKAESAQYMIDEITHVIKTFGKRAPGSEGEKKAVEYMGEVLAPYSDDVKIEPFKLNPAAFYGWIYFTMTFVLIACVTNFFLPIVSIIAVLLALSLMFGEFVLYRKMVDKLFPEKTSYNLIAVKHPKGQVKRRIFFNGHPDAAPEWTLNNLGGGVLFISHIVVVIVGVLYVLGLAIASLIISKDVGFLMVNNIASPKAGGLAIAMYTTIAWVPLWILMFWMQNPKIIVDGANDNLTGCYMGIAIMKAMHEKGLELENTEVGVLLTGSEEAGLRGAKAFCEMHPQDYHDVETIIFAYDTLHEIKYLFANTKDLNGLVKADEYTSKLFMKGCANEGVNCSKGMVPFGATDSAAFAQGGYKAVGITALNHNLQDYYHTRKDSYDNLDKGCLADVFVASVEALRIFDAGESVE